MNLVRLPVRRASAAILLAAVSTAVFAQAPSSPPRAVEPPKPACTKAGEFPGNVTGSDRQKRAWLKEVNDYLDCIKKFAEEQGALAQAHAKAAGAAIDEYNAVVKATNEIVK